MAPCSSGLACALFVLAALEIARPPARPALRWLAVFALALLAAKIVWEAVLQTPVASGPLPAGVEVLPLVHLLGGGAGALAFAVVRRRSLA